MRLLRPLARWFRCNIDGERLNAGKTNGAGKNLLRDPFPENNQKKTGPDLLKELCTLVSNSSTRSETIPSATSPSKLLQQEMNRLKSSRRRRRREPDVLLTDADLILDVLRGLKPGESLSEVLNVEFPHLTDELVSKVVLGAPGLDSATSFFDWVSASREYSPGTLAFDALIQLLVKAGKLEEAERKLELAREKLLAPSTFSYGVLIRALGAQGNAHGALKLFQRGTHGSGKEVLVKLLGFLVSGLCKGGRVSEATEVYERWKTSVRLEVVVYNTIIDGLVRSKLSTKALEVFRDMQAAFVSPNSHTYQALVSGLCMSGRVDEACEIFDGMLENTLITPHVVLFTTLIDCLCKTLQFDRACVYLERVNDPDIVTYSALINGLCSTGRVDYAQELLQQITQRGNLKPDVVLYNIFIKGLCKAEQLEDALELFHKMEGNGVSPNTITYNTLMRGLCWKHRVDDARKLFREMIGRGCKPDSGTYTIISWCFLKTPSSEEARRLVEEARQERERFSSSSASDERKTIDELCEAGELPEAHRKLREIPQPESGIYSSLIRGYLRKGRFLEADQLLGEMLEKGGSPGYETQRAIMAGLRALIRGKKVRGFVEEMVSEMAVKHWAPNAILFNILVGGLSEAGYISSAYQLVKHAGGDRLRSHVWDTLILKLKKAGKTELCLVAMEQATKLGVELHPLTRMAVIKKLSDTGMLDESVELLREMVANNKHCTRQMAVVHSKVNSNLCESGRTQEALELHQELIRRGLIPTKRCYNVLINHQCSAGMLELAERLRYQMQQSGTGASFRTFELLVEAYCEHGLLERAFGVIQEMRSYGFIPRLKNYRPLVVKLCEAGRADEAFQVLRQILVLGKAPHVFAYCDVFQAFYGAGRIDEAREVFQEMLRFYRIDYEREDFSITVEQIRIIFR